MKFKKSLLQNRKIRRWVVRGLVIGGTLAVTLGAPFGMNDPSANEQANKQETVANTNVAYAESKPAEKGVWTLYARILMGDKEVNDSAAKTGQMNLLGQGGISADFPYSDISKQGNAIAGGHAGTQLASTLATYNYYGYIETVSGNAIASQASSFIGGIGRTLGSFIGSISLILSNIAESINELLGKFFMSMNIFSLMGWGKGGSDVSNPVSKALTSLLNNLGLNNQLFKAIASLSMLFFTAILGYQGMKLLSKEGVNSKGLSPVLEKWIVRIFVLFVFLPVAGSLLGVYINGIQSAKEDGKLPTNVVGDYIINTRLWASTQNLAPSSDTGGNVPNGKPTSEIKFVDTDYEPSKKSEMIRMINTSSYARQNNDLDSNSVGMALLKEWSSNDTFNVNTYAGDVNVAENDAYMGRAPAVWTGYNLGDGKEGNAIKKPTNLNGYIWSANQNVTDDNRKPDGKGTTNNFDATQPWGVANNATFSTQSVALMLQSALDTSGSKFYAYNIAPSGIQGSAKNMSTVKTEWRTASLVGHGAMGKFGSWLAMNAESIVLAVLYLACAWAMFNVNIVKAFKREFVRVWEVVLTGSLAAGAGVMAISLGVVTTSLIGLQLPIFLITFVRAFGDTAVGFIPNTLLGDGVANIVRSAMVLGVGYLLVFKKGEKVNNNLINMLIGLPLEVAFGFDERAKLLFGNRNDAVRVVDGVSKAIKKSQGAKNPYYDGGRGSVKDMVAGGLGAVGAQGIADRLNNMGDSNADAKSIADKVVPETPTTTPFNGGGVATINNTSFKDLVRQDQLRSNSQQYSDPLGRMVDAKGNFVDENGEVLKDSKYGKDAKGNFIDEKGRLVDEDGNLVDTNGKPLEDNEDGNGNIGMDSQGRLIDEKGRLVDEDGNLVDENGRKLLNGDYGQDVNGRLIDDQGRLVDEDGNLVDEFGKKLGKHSNGYNVNGDTVDEDGNIIDSRDALVADRNKELEQQHTPIAVAIPDDESDEVILDQAHQGLREEAKDEVVSDEIHQELRDKSNGEDVSNQFHQTAGNETAVDDQSRELNNNFDNVADRNDTVLKDRETLRKGTDKDQAEVKKKPIPTPNGSTVPKINQTNNSENAGLGMAKDNQSIREPKKTTENSKSNQSKPTSEKTGEKTGKSKEPSKKPSKAKSAVEYLSKTGKNVYSSADKALAKAPKGSLAGMTYEAKNEAIKLGKGTAKVAKVTAKGATKTGRAVKKSTMSVKDYIAKYSDQKTTDKKSEE
ncbi:TPA: hypothetical protein IX611_001745 [Enterococcus faecium]|uniref:hypothetical protein n=1 Tax=Enterococcus faecalis TaxID=1351 RepID=UPI001E40CCD4|nr:hypothetical protein [Enterococcus faecalis]HAQ6468811.1 hypothetical protein [Enterococcus faecium]MCE2569414.1 hypothetical protein [Enterococcus faecalis]HAQ6564823.1 hypothetical protein [Enterococcus faecium]HAQ7376052.1 hypothetical protein [Enterococcus faecium]HAQ7601442.1 hypothetical protein [Enterococcus faecium]